MWINLTNGIANCTFSNTGSKVAAVGMDEDHTIVIYDIAKGIEHKKNALSKNDGLIAKGKVTRREIFDIRFVPGDWQLVVACMKEVNLITWKNGNLLSERTIWKDFRPEAALCIGFIEGYTVTGMFSG